MNTIKVDATWLEASGIKAVVRIADGNRFFRFFDKRQRRLYALLRVVAECELVVRYVATQPELLLCIADPDDWDGSDSDRRAKPHFYREVVRAGLLIEKFAKLVDRHSELVVDYPPPSCLKGMELVSNRSLRDELEDQAGHSPTLSDSVPEALERRVDAFVNQVVPPGTWMIGSCHVLWGLKKTILQYGFNRRWKTPAEARPDVLFD